jgi:hypothetical protein
VAATSRSGSLVGSVGVSADEERRRALELARRFPNITGFIMDDLFHEDGSGTLSPEQLKALRGQLVVDGRKRDLSPFSRRKPGVKECFHRRPPRRVGQR